MTSAQYIIIAIGFLLNMVDGIDVVAMSVAAPSLSQEWQISSVEMGYILSAALFGMMFGALFLAPLGDQYGRRKIVLFAVFLTGVSMIITGFIGQSVPLMIIMRTICGIGIGAIFAIAATLGGEFTPDKYKNFSISMIVAGYPFGAMIIGPIAAIIIPSYGWQFLFIAAGSVTLLIFVIAYFRLPESVEYLDGSSLGPHEKLLAINNILRRINKKPINALPEKLEQNANTIIRVGGLFTHDLLKTTLKLWIIFIMGFLTIYFLLSWIPSMLVNSGYTMVEGIYALTLNNLGAMFGITLIGFLTTRYKLAWPVGCFFAITAGLMTYFAITKPTDLWTLYAIMMIIGIFNNGAISAMYAVGARVYHTYIRTTGVGWAAGLGRTGAIAAPILAGYLISMNFSMYTMFAVFAVPAIIAALLIITIRV
ncbi:MAG: MFS transporter [Emcibacteraceae bacterium]|nr:MFS transporter [Emcibacteraceae bacterium]